MTAPESLDGIISYLAKKHGGNAEKKGIVKMTSNLRSSDVANVADLTSAWYFHRVNDRGE
jgi:hypothetical protein